MNAAEPALHLEAPCPACSTVVTVLQADAGRWARCPKCNRPFVPADEVARAALKVTPFKSKPGKAEKAFWSAPVPPSQASLFGSMIRLSVFLLRLWMILMSIRNLFWIGFYNLWDTAFYAVVIVAMIWPKWFSATEE